MGLTYWIIHLLDVFAMVRGATTSAAIVSWAWAARLGGYTTTISYCTHPSSDTKKLFLATWISTRKSICVQLSLETVFKQWLKTANFHWKLSTKLNYYNSYNLPTFSWRKTNRWTFKHLDTNHCWYCNCSRKLWQFLHGRRYNNLINDVFCTKSASSCLVLFVKYDGCGWYCF